VARAWFLLSGCKKCSKAAIKLGIATITDTDGTLIDLATNTEVEPPSWVCGGGDLLIADVSGGNEEDEVHYWNRFPGGIEIDLTREQFGSHRVFGEPRVVVRPPEGPRAYVREYQFLRARVL
jgi:hypothetical protein